MTRLNAELDEARKKFNKMKDDFENKLKCLKTEMELNKVENEKTIAEINSLTPEYDELCGVYQAKVKDYDETKLKYIGI